MRKLWLGQGKGLLQRRTVTKWKANAWNANNRLHGITYPWGAGKRLLLYFPANVDLWDLR